MDDLWSHMVSIRQVESRYSCFWPFMFHDSTHDSTSSNLRSNHIAISLSSTCLRYQASKTHLIYDCQVGTLIRQRLHRGLEPRLVWPEVQYLLVFSVGYCQSLHYSSVVFLSSPQHIFFRYEVLVLCNYFVSTIVNIWWNFNNVLIFLSKNSAKDIGPWKCQTSSSSKCKANKNQWMYKFCSNIWRYTFCKLGKDIGLAPCKNDNFIIFNCFLGRIYWFFNIF